MAKIKRLIPFDWLPANWGLTGSRRARAHAEYYLDGEDLAYRLLDIDYPDLSDKECDWQMEYRTDKLKLDYRYHKIGEFEYGLGIIENDVKLSEVERERSIAKYLNKFGRLSAEELEYKLFDLSYEVKDTEAYQRERLKLDIRFGKKTEEQADRELLDIRFADKNSIDYKIGQLAIDLKFGKLTQDQHDKQVATLNKEPWFNMIGADHKIRGDNAQLAIELDWNDLFIQYLEDKGWTGRTPDEIVDKWFEEAMRQMLQIDDPEAIDDGTSDPLPMASLNRVKRDDGLTEYL
jgi:hypothetical protein